MKQLKNLVPALACICTVLAGVFLPQWAVARSDRDLLGAVYTQPMEQPVEAGQSAIAARLRLLARPASVASPLAGSFEVEEVLLPLERELETLRDAGLFPDLLFDGDWSPSLAVPLLVMDRERPTRSAVIWVVQLDHIQRGFAQFCLDDDTGKLLEYKIFLPGGELQLESSTALAERWMNYLELEANTSLYGDRTFETVYSSIYDRYGAFESLERWDNPGRLDRECDRTVFYLVDESGSNTPYRLSSSEELVWFGVLDASLMQTG